MDEVKADRKLEGKINFTSWKREFERAAKAGDTFEYLTGEEVVPPKPKKDDYFAKPGDADIRRSTRTKKISTPTVDDGDETGDAQATLFTSNNNFRWQIDYNEHKSAKEKMKLATKLLDSWISDGIKIEIEDCTNAKEAYDLINFHGASPSMVVDIYKNQRGECTLGIGKLGEGDVSRSFVGGLD